MTPTAKLWSWTRGSAEFLGWATTVSLIFFWCTVAWSERETKQRYAAPAINVSPTAQKIAAKFSPALQQLASAHKDEAIGSVDGLVQRWCVGKVWDPAVKAIPRATEIGCDRALSYLDSMPMSEVAGLMIEHAKASGCRVHYSVWATAEHQWAITP
ncbi:hypothetical protein [Singulisphaera acidiphila]|uniref:Uncharacterized protein n=1 Tax=Singulisphaera acidiphila (strain ATCC BAA-1392 / DSM 18658 / VKM B-2454 / MOB10) TaxID=886293 RepID=L0DHX2_SINAD|nr:hypothetical protein [Singulisphaera acidiphila]AGA28403.1 hypothetical protein Sinac_4199 [Singulisphaera acidiphila DSM 18658]